MISGSTESWEAGRLEGLEAGRLGGWEAKKQRILIGHRPARLALLAWRAGTHRCSQIKKIFESQMLKKICVNL